MKSYNEIIFNLVNENKTLKSQAEYHANYVNKLNEKVSLIYKENDTVLNDIIELDTQLAVEELKQVSLNDETEVEVLNDLDSEYTKELAALKEKIDHYRDVFKLEVQYFKESKKVELNFLNVNQKLKIEYYSIRNLKAFVDEYSMKMIETGNDE